MKNLFSALVKAQKDFSPALKTKTNPHLKSKYADLSACVEAVIDSLNGNGIMLTQHTQRCNDGIIVETVFVHESGEQLSCGELYVKAPKNDPQGFGSALTYARRYSLMAACGIAPEDDDGNAARGSKDDAYEGFEAQHLPALRNAAMQGKEALQKAFMALPAGDMKKKLWETHGASLKAATEVK